MTYILLIITGILGLIGVLFETSNEKDSTRVFKKPNWVGVLVLVLLSSVSILSINMEYEKSIKTKQLEEENLYLNLTQLEIGPAFQISIQMKDSVLNTNTLEILAEMKGELNYIDSTQYDNGGIILRNKSDSLRSEKVVSQLKSDIKHSFIDSKSLRVLFANKNSQKQRYSDLARIVIDNGILDYDIFISNNGVVWPKLIIDNFISSRLDSSVSPFIAQKKHEIETLKNKIFIIGEYEEKIKASTLYASVRNDNRKNVQPSFIELYFDNKPNNELIKKANKQLESIKWILVQVAYDPDALRWFNIKLELTDKFEINKIENEKKWVMKKPLILNELPSISNINLN